MVPTRSVLDRLTSSRYRLIIAAVVVCAACASYLLAAVAEVGHLGFPLDDSWIHQTYARNLVDNGEWSFVPETPSTGATSLIWPLLLAPAHLLSIDPRVWSYVMGAISLLLMARLAGHFFPETTPGHALIAALAVATEWHLVWAAVSGMETILISAAILAFWVWYFRHHPGVNGYYWRDGLLLGLWGGGLMLIRPEGILAPAIGGLLVVFVRGDWRKRLMWALAAGAGLALTVGPFLAFNRAISGDYFPNTFYAKQTEYQILWSIPFVRRLYDQALISLIGPQLVLLPGLIGLAIGAVLSRNRFAETHTGEQVSQESQNASNAQLVYLLPLIWVVCHWAIFAARLPQTYQHGRYAMPTVAILVIYGVRGAVRLSRPRSRKTMLRVASVAWLATAGLLFPGMLLVLGAPAYAADVAFIDDEMVATAHWIAENTATTDVIAAHDIGALGYFAPRPLVDLAGLVSPDVIPFMTDADQLYEFVQSEGAAYLVVFPGWSSSYEQLTSFPGLCPVWSATENPGYVERSGAGAMTVYRLLPDTMCTD